MEPLFHNFVTFNDFFIFLFVFGESYYKMIFFLNKLLTIIISYFNLTYEHNYQREVLHMTLSELPLGKEAIIISVGGEGALRCRLLDMGIIPKTRVIKRKTAPMGDPIEIHLRGYELTIRKADAEKILVTTTEETL